MLCHFDLLYENGLLGNYVNLDERGKFMLLEKCHVWNSERDRFFPPASSFWLYSALFISVGGLFSEF